MGQQSSAVDRQAVREIIESALKSGVSALDSSQSKALLQAYGLPVAEQLSPCGREFLVGMKRDPVFGPVVAFGLGGVLGEALSDTVMALAPVDDRHAAELPGLIKAASLLGPLGDQPSVDRTILAGMIQAVGQMAVDNPEIVEIVADPVAMQGDSLVVTDARVVLAPVAEAKRQERRAFKPSLAVLLAPHAVAVVGASGDVTKLGGSVLRNIVDGGYAGKVYPINPKGGVFFGVQAYLSIEDLPESPDLALLAVPGQQVLPLVHESVRKRVGAVVVLAAGFSETGAAGVEAERELARVASEGAVTLMGPNCLGLISNELSLHAVGPVELHPPKGPLSLVSQSGSLGVVIAKECRRRGIGIEKFASVGNEAQIGVTHLLDYLRDDPLTSCILMYIEGLDDGRRFVEAARRTVEVKPVVVLRAAVTEYGTEAAASHTGAPAVSAAVWEAAAREAGVVTCTSVQELVDLGACLAYLPLPKGRRVAVITQGGGAGVLAADEVARHGLVLAGLSPESSGSLKTVVEREGVDAVIVLCAQETSALAQAAELMESTGKPIVIVPDPLTEGPVGDSGKKYRPVVVSSVGAAARALEQMEWFAAHRREHGPLA